MSLRRVDYDASSMLQHQLLQPDPAAAAVGATAIQGVTISEQLGLRNAGPAKPYVPFRPQHPAPQVVGNAVDEAFLAYGVAPSGLAGLPNVGPDTAGMMGDALAKAKAKANAAVLKSKELASRAAAASKAAASKAAAKTKSAAKSAAAAAGERLSRMGEDSDSDSEDEDGKKAAKAKPKAK
jgi:hypothetical protein